MPATLALLDPLPFRLGVNGTWPGGRRLPLTGVSVTSSYGDDGERFDAGVRICRGRVRLRGARRGMTDSASVVIGGPYPVLDCLNPRELATFYCELLGWEVADDDAGEDDPGWVGLRSPDGQRMMSLQREARYEPPTWPADGTHNR